MSRYAIVDIETTGLSPAHNHRIVEIAVVLVDDAGDVIYEWETLVNPQRDVGASEIHGLSGADIYLAPTFEQVAGELGSLLQGRVPVAHNLAFDAPFIASEFERLGYEVPLTRTSGLCTMRMASLYLPVGSRTLEACCSSIGYSPSAAHSALDDARAAAALLSYYLRTADAFLENWQYVIATAQKNEWPEMPAMTMRRVSRANVAVSRSEHFLARLASRAPRSEIHPSANSYLALLDRVLLDRQLSLHEQDELVAAADMMGIAREDAFTLHRRYLSALGRIALKDGIVTVKEMNDLLLVAGMLGLSEDDVTDALDPLGLDAGVQCEVGNFELNPGNAIVFTGESPGVDRCELEYQAKALGLRVTGTVSGKTTLVVATDPDSLSGKARKARDLGVPIVDFATYAQLLDAMSCRHPA